MKLNHRYYIHPREGAAHLDLCGEWDLGFTDDAVSSPSKVEWTLRTQAPNSVYWSLYEAGVMPHPYEGCNSKLYHWVDEKVWYYKKSFHMPKEQAGCDAVICFEGVAYYSRVWVNGVYIGDHEGMFGGPVFHAGDVLRAGETNEIVIEIKACTYGKKDSWHCQNAQITNREIVPWNSARDWVTSTGDFIVMGLWNKVRVEFLPTVHISRPFLCTQSVDENGTANLAFSCELVDGTIDELVQNAEDEQYTFAYSPGLIFAPQDRPVQIRIEISDNAGNSAFCMNEDVTIHNPRRSCMREDYYECSFYEKSFTIDNARLWYPHTMGEPHLYSVKISLLDNGAELDSISFDFGIRTVALTKTAGRRMAARWEKYQFVINGQKIFLRGMNRTPMDFLYKINAEDYRRELNLMKDAEIEFVRVWNGGGFPETDDFYNICDRLGLLVWQDLFIANMQSSSWPQDILQDQTVMNICRLRNHPSLAVYCGGNEFNPYSEHNAASMFVQARNAEDYDPGRHFFRATPDRGSAHIYRDMEPTWFRHTYSEVPFIAEAGIHAFPNYKSIKKLIPREESEGSLPDLAAPEFAKRFPGLLNHITEYRPDRIPRMLSRASMICDMKQIKLQELCEATHVAACEFYQIMIQAARENYPVTSGIMPWVFKRSWTTVAIQLIDGMGEPIAPYYYVKKAYSPVNISVALAHLSMAPGEALPIEIRILNDRGVDLTGAEVEFALYDPELMPVRCDCISVDGRDRIVLSSFDIPQEYEDKFFFIYTTLRKAGTVLSESVYWPKCLSRFKDSELLREYRSCPSENIYFEKGPWLKPQLRGAKQAELVCSAKDIKVNKDSATLSLSIENISDTPAFFVKIDTDNDDSFCVCSDNCFFMENGMREIIVDINFRKEMADDTVLCVGAFNAKSIRIILPKQGAIS